MTIIELFKTVHPSVLAAKMIFRYLQKTYSVLKISQIADTTSGGTPNRGIVEYYNGSIPWVKSGELKDTLITKCEEFISETGLKNSSAKVFPKGTLLVAMYGANIGKTGVLDFDAATNQAVCAIFPKVDISKDYLFWYFKQQRIDFIAIGKGGAQPNISQTVINNAKIVVPDRKIQDEIVTFLENIENNIIDENFIIKEVLKDISTIYHYKNSYVGLSKNFSDQLTLIENLNQSILQEAVQGKLVPQDPTDEPASELLKRIKEEKAKSGKKEKPLPPIKPEEIPFEIPKNWVWCRLAQVFESGSGGTPERSNPSFWNGTINWLKSGELNDDYLDNDSQEKITEEGLRKSSAKLFPKRTLLIALYGATAGKLGILNFESTTNQAICGFFENRHLDTKYLFYYLRAFRQKIISDSWGQAQPNISQAYLRDFLFAIPPLSEQKRIVAEIENQLEKTKQLKAHVLANQAATEQLLKALLQEAFAVEEK